MERPPSFTVGRVKLKVTRLPNATDSRCNGYRNPMAFLTETETPALNSYGTARPHTCTRPGGTSKVGTCTYCFPNLLQDCGQWGSRWTRAAGSTLIAWLVPGPCPTNLGLRAHTRRGRLSPVSPCPSATSSTCPRLHSSASSPLSSACPGVFALPASCVTALPVPVAMQASPPLSPDCSSALAWGSVGPAQ